MNSRFRNIITISLGCLIWQSTVQPASAASWSITQYCQPYGPVRFDVGPDGAKLASNRLTILMSGSGPTRIYNNSSKSFCELASESASKKFSFMTTPGQPVKGASRDMLNVRATQYWCGGFDRKGRMVYTTEVWTSNDLNLPAAYTNKYLKMCGLPIGLGMPLKVMRHYGDVKDPAHKRAIFLDTFKLNSANLSPSNFAAPTGYKQVADEMEVLIGDQLD